MRDSQKKALGVAVRLATAGVLVGCQAEPRRAPDAPHGGQTYGGKGTACANPPPGGAPGAPNPVATAPGVGQPGPTPPTATSPVRTAAPVAPASGGCDRVIAEAIAADGTPGVGNTRFQSGKDPALSACCDAHLQQVTAARDDTRLTVVYQCCQVAPDAYTKYQRLCAPWGPAMPLAIDAPCAARMRDVVLLDLVDEARALGLVVDAPARLRAVATGTWLDRMVNEHGSSRVFEDLACQLRAVGWEDEAAAAETFSEEEKRHGVACGAVALALGGEARAPALPPRTMPSHPDAVSPREAVLRNVMSTCCLHETVAIALVGAERWEMAEGDLRDLLTSIWSDEIGHARFGWDLLARVAPSLDDDERAGLGRYLARALDHLESHEHEHLPLEPDLGDDPEARALGLCSGRDGRALFAAVRDQAILPGLARLGVVPLAA